MTPPIHRFRKSSAAATSRLRTIPAALLFIGAATLLAAGPTPARAQQELIRSYHSDVTIAPDGALTVTETIDVVTAGDAINHGIFRDLLKTYRTDDGTKILVDYDILSVHRDGAPEASRTDKGPDAIRLYVGRSDVVLPPGRHRFEITYRTDGHIRAWSDADGIAWNVTGNDWAFPIEHASARLRLPTGVTPITAEAFTGRRGSTENNASVAVSGATVTAETTVPLAKGEGLTLKVTWPKGAVAFSPPQVAPGLIEGFSFQTPNMMIGWVLIAIALALYLGAWFAVGRDPRRGIVVPQYAAPEGISPAAAAFIDGKGSSSSENTFSAVVLQLAIGGYLIVEETAGPGGEDDVEITLHRTAKPVTSALAPEESALIEEIDAQDGRLAIQSENSMRVQAATKAVSRSLARSHGGKIYRFNAEVIIGALVGTLVAVAAFITIGSFDAGIGEYAGLALLAGAILFAGFSMLRVFVGQKSPLTLKLIGAGMTIIPLVLAAAFLFIGFKDTTPIQRGTQILPLDITVLALVALAAIFFPLIGRWTARGRAAKDVVDGLRLYLSVAETDRINMPDPEPITERRYEELLPYAVALGVERLWTARFSAELQAATKTYEPSWQSGSSSSFATSGASALAVAGALGTAVSAATPTPSSSSSSSGGSSSSSGGGSGGGGGGGW